MHRIIEEDIRNICKEPLPWEELKKKKILVTGASGFLASYIVYTLMKCNFYYHLDMSLYVLCRNIKKAREKFQKYLDNRQLILLLQDVREDIPCNLKFDIIIHAASPANRFMCEMRPWEVVETNVLAYNKLFKNLNGNSKLLFISSSAVYGSNTPFEVDETYRTAIDFASYKNVYALSKQMCEMISDVMRTRGKTEISIVRPFVVFGPGDKNRNGKALTDFIGNYLKNETIRLKSDGSAIRSYIYIKDAVSAIFYVLLLGEGKNYNICSKKNEMSIYQLAKLIATDLGKTLNIEIIDRDILGNGAKCLVGDNGKLEGLGWRDETDIIEGLSRTLVWALESDYFSE